MSNRRSSHFAMSLFAPPTPGTDEPRYPFTVEWPDGQRDLVTSEAVGWEAIERYRIRRAISSIEMIYLALELGGVRAIEPAATVEVNLAQGELMPAPAMRYE